MVGHDNVRERLTSLGKIPEDAARHWEDDLELFETVREQYLLY